MLFCRSLKSQKLGGDLLEKFELTDLVDKVQLQKLLDALFEASGIPSGIVDLEGNVVAGAGWQRACVDFHRASPACCLRCNQSDIYLARESLRIATSPENDDEVRYAGYKCENGIWDIAIPIIIDGQYLANYFLGQFFYENETIDWEWFKKQADTFGFDQESYLNAIGELPRLSESKVQAILKFNKVLVETLCISASQKRYQRSLLAQINETKQSLLQHDQGLATNLKTSANHSVRKEDLKIIIHDMKSPLSGIAGLAKLIEEENGGRANAEHLKMIAEVSASLVRQIDEILLLGEAEDPIDIVPKTPINMKQLSDLIDQKFALEARYRGINLHQNLRPEAHLISNEHYLWLILSNLISNAFKYISTGSHVYIDGKVVGNQYQIEIADDGIGIPASKQGLLFQKFGVTGNKPQNGESSTGIGLYISKKLANKVNCQLGFRPNLPKGSVFSVVLPLGSSC